MQRPLDDQLAALLATLGSPESSAPRLLQAVLRSTHDGVMIGDAAGQLFLNRAARRMFNFTEDEPITREMMPTEVFHLHDFASLPMQDRPLLRALRGEETRDLEVFIRHDAGGSVVKVNAVPLRGPDQSIVAGLVTLADEGERRRAEEELRAANTRLNGWVHELQRRTDVIMLMNDMADLLQSCRTVEEFCKVVSTFGERIFAGETGSVFVVNASRSAIERVASWGKESGNERVFAPDACWALRRGRLHRTGGEALGPSCEHGHGPGTAICIPMMGQGEALGVLHVQHNAAVAEGEIGAAMAESRLRTAISVAEHVALALANLKLRETLQMQAIRDPLTGLFNRRYMEETLDRELARAARSGAPLAAVMIDIDHFKRYNDMFGHAAADVALRETAGVIRAALHSEDVACRFGGEELLVIMPETSVEAAVARAESIRIAISGQQVRYRGTALGRITASFGVATVPGQASNAAGLLRAADEALYEAKGSGRDRVCAGRANSPSKSMSVAPLRVREGAPS